MYQNLGHMHYAQGATVNGLVNELMGAILSVGEHVPSRNGGATTLYNVEMALTNPRERYLNLVGRKSNIFQLIAETIWVCAQQDRVTGYLEFFLPRAPEYSDDGVTWRGAYGPRLFEYGQMQGVIERFEKDKMTRQAVVDIYQSEKDSPSSIREEYGLESSKDTPCNDFILFWIEPDNTFHMKTIQRSGDVIFGMGSINMFEFSFIHEWIFSLVKKIYPEIKLGAYHHNTTNLHLYDFTRSQAEAVRANMQYIGERADQHTAIFPSTLLRGQKFFRKLFNVLEAGIVRKEFSPFTTELDSVFAEFAVPSDSLLGRYVSLLHSYIWAKRSPDTMPEGFAHDLTDYPTALAAAVQDCSFTKFKVENRNG